MTIEKRKVKENWYPSSWRKRNYGQLPPYKSQKHEQKVIKHLQKYPSLVTFKKVDVLRKLLIEVEKGKRFILQGGDCAESFSNCNKNYIFNQLDVLFGMGEILNKGLQKPIVYIGRIAGQYAKPRSENQEIKNGVVLPSYFGDIINRIEFLKNARTLDPELMIKGYKCSALTLKYIRELLQKVNTKTLYQDLITNVDQSVKTKRRIFADYQHNFFVSHEALLLPYEEAFTCKNKISKSWYNLSTHLPWLGMRTVDIEGAYVDYVRGINNPVGIKVGPAMGKEHLLELINMLNEDNQSGKIVLIHRFGYDNIVNKLPDLIDAVRLKNKKVIWVCDPMHGNTEIIEQHIKTRKIEAILGELLLALKIHAENNSYLGGIHLELTGDTVVECIDNNNGVSKNNHMFLYKSLLDPRLNREQSLTVAAEFVSGCKSLIGS